MNFLAPFKFYKNEPRTVTVEARIHPHAGAVVAYCKLIGRRQLPNQIEPQVTTHFAARVRLSKSPQKATIGPKLSTPAGKVVEAPEIYRLYFHGPAYQVVERAWWDGERIVGLMKAGLPDNHQPANLLTLMGPRLIELCFQTAGVWEMGIEGRMGLPQHIDRVTVLRTSDPGTRLYAVVNPNPSQGSFDAEILDADGNRYVQLTGYRTVAVPNAVDAEKVKVLHAIMQLEPVAA